MIAATPLLHDLITKAPITMLRGYCLVMLAVMSLTEFTLINLWVNCARLYAALNNQGGIANTGRFTGESQANANFAIRFKKVLAVVGNLYMEDSGRSEANYDDNIEELTVSSVKFRHFKHTYIAIGV